MVTKHKLKTFIILAALSGADCNPPCSYDLGSCTWGDVHTVLEYSDRGSNPMDGSGHYVQIGDVRARAYSEPMTCPPGCTAQASMEITALSSTCSIGDTAADGHGEFKLDGFILSAGKPHTYRLGDRVYVFTAEAITPATVAFSVVVTCTGDAAISD
jgi:hypothetical protein